MIKNNTNKPDIPLFKNGLVNLLRIEPSTGHEWLNDWHSSTNRRGWGGRVVRWSWINFQVRGVLLVWIRVGQGPTALAVGAGGGCLDIFTLVYPSSFLSPSLWETTRYRLKYCLKGSLSPKTTNRLIGATVELELGVIS